MKLIIALFIILAVCSINGFAQKVKTVMYVMKDGKEVYQSPVSDIEYITFD